MLQTECERLEKEIASLLEQERAALLEGNLTKLAALTSQKTAAFRRIDQNEMPKHVLQNLTQQSKDNQNLYAAVLNGLRAVQDRLASVRAAQSGFSVYDQSGISRAIGDASAQRTLKA